MYLVVGLGWCAGGVRADCSFLVVEMKQKCNAVHMETDKSYKKGEFVCVSE